MMVVNPHLMKGEVKMNSGNKYIRDARDRINKVNVTSRLEYLRDINDNLDNTNELELKGRYGQPLRYRKSGKIKMLLDSIKGNIKVLNAGMSNDGMIGNKSSIFTDLGIKETNINRFRDVEFTAEYIENVRDSMLTQQVRNLLEERGASRFRDTYLVDTILAPIENVEEYLGDLVNYIRNYNTEYFIKAGVIRYYLDYIRPFSAGAEDVSRAIPVQYLMQKGMFKEGVFNVEEVDREYYYKLEDIYNDINKDPYNDITEYLELYLSIINKTILERLGWYVGPAVIYKHEMKTRIIVSMLVEDETETTVEEVNEKFNLEPQESKELLNYLVEMDIMEIDSNVYRLIPELVGVIR